MFSANRGYIETTYFCVQFSIFMLWQYCTCALGRLSHNNNKKKTLEKVMFWLKISGFSHHRYSWKHPTRFFSSPAFVATNTAGDWPILKNIQCCSNEKMLKHSLKLKMTGLAASFSCNCITISSASCCNSQFMNKLCEHNGRNFITQLPEYVLMLGTFLQKHKFKLYVWLEILFLIPIKMSVNVLTSWVKHSVLIAANVTGNVPRST